MKQVQAETAAGSALKRIVNKGVQAFREATWEDINSEIRELAEEHCVTLLRGIVNGDVPPRVGHADIRHMFHLVLGHEADWEQAFLSPDHQIRRKSLANVSSSSSSFSVASSTSKPLPAPALSTSLRSHPNSFSFSSQSQSHSTFAKSGGSSAQREIETAIVQRYPREESKRESLNHVKSPVIAAYERSPMSWSSSPQTCASNFSPSLNFSLNPSSNAAPPYLEELEL